MRFLSLTLLGLASTCLATPAAEAALERRADGTQVVLKAFSAIYARISTFDKLLYPFNSTDLNLQLDLANKAFPITDEVNSQTAKIKKAGNIPYGCVLNVASHAQNLIDRVAATLEELATKKPLTDASGASGIVTGILNDLLTATDNLIAALRPKIPASARFLVTGDKRQLDLLLQNAIDLYNEPAPST